MEIGDYDCTALWGCFETDDESMKLFKKYLKEKFDYKKDTEWYVGRVIMPFEGIVFKEHPETIKIGTIEKIGDIIK